MTGFFSAPYAAEPAGLWTRDHLLLLVVTVFGIVMALVWSKGMPYARKRRVIGIEALCLWGLEIAKILFVVFVQGSQNPNDFLPLYYCSLELYLAPLCLIRRQTVRDFGNAFLATGGLFGGVAFLLFPTTSLPRYPAFHFISLHSFFLHGVMVYLGLLLLVTGCYRVRLRDIRCCVLPVTVMSAISLVFNTVYDRISGQSVANLMFLSKDFPGTPISVLYRAVGPRLFPLAMWLLQALVPFLLVYAIVLLVRRLRGGDPGA